MTDQALIEAGRRWREAHDALEALPPDDPREAAQWSVIDEAETAIQTATAATPEGVALQLWVALYHTQTDRETGLASIRHDLAGVLSREQEFDFHARLIVGALRSLSGMTSRLATNRTAALQDGSFAEDEGCASFGAKRAGPGCIIADSDTAADDYGCDPDEGV